MRIFRRKMIWLQLRYSFLRPANLAKVTAVAVVLFFLWSRLLSSRSTLTFHFREVFKPSTGSGSLYKAYSGRKIVSGLDTVEREFMLNGKPIRIYSGAIHYFRVHPEYWRDRLRKLRAAEFNTVETYVAWNLHEPRRGKYNFEGWLDIARFITIAKEEDLFVILRPGPYICSEWDFGGMPSWLLRESKMVANDVSSYTQLRTTYPGFMKPASKYLAAVIAQVQHLQWSPKNGAQPIIAAQIENEYTIFGNTIEDSAMYLKLLHRTMMNAGLSDVLYFTSDGPDSLGSRGSLPGILQTINFNSKVEESLQWLEEMQPDRPRMVMELWTGWFDHWLEAGHHVLTPRDYLSLLEPIMESNTSVNLYMFHGGTTFGFMPGANTFTQAFEYLPDINSYDYDAVLTEAGDYTRKYWLAMELLRKYSLNRNLQHPAPPEEMRKVALPEQQPRYYIGLKDLVKQLTPSVWTRPINMEQLDINEGNGQSYGFIMYRKDNVVIRKSSSMVITGRIRDILYIMVDGKLITKPLTTPEDITKPGFWTRGSPRKVFELPGDGLRHRVDLLVENHGRMNFGTSDKFNEKKGIYGGHIYVDDEEVTDWKIYPLEFNQTWVRRLQDWRKVIGNEGWKEPTLFKFSMKISEDEHYDTFLKTEGWTKGQIFVNSFNLGRYWDMGPTKTSYIPAPLMKKGLNEILLFELFQPGKSITFQSFPELGSPDLPDTRVQVEGFIDQKEDENEQEEEVGMEIQG